MKKLVLSLFVIHYSLFTFHSGQAQILHVPAEYPTIQAAVDAAGYGDTVLVDTGNYQENIVIQGNDKTITLASNFLLTSDTNDINNTIIDAGQPVDSNFRMGVLFRYQDSTLNAKLTGFTIQNGGGYYRTYGGGIYVWHASPTIEYNHIQNCYVTGIQSHGGGIHVGNDLGETNTTYIRENVIKNCTVNSTAWAAGGGISINAGKTIVENNQISHNLLTGEIAGTYSGGGIFLLNPTEGTIISSNIITDNTLPVYGTCIGGGIFLEKDDLDTLGGIPLIEGNRIQKNMAKRGGGIYCVRIGIKMINNIISGNIATIEGGGIKIIGPANDYEVTEIFNNTIFENTVSGNGSGGGMAVGGTSIFLLMNNIFHDDQASNEIIVNTGIIHIYNCNLDTMIQILGNWKGEGNFPGDPSFSDDDCHIDEYSCCEDAGIDSVEMEGIWYYAPATDMEGELRPYHLATDVGSDECDIISKIANDRSSSKNIPVAAMPNPFNNHIILEYVIEQPGQVILTICDSRGKQVAMPVNEFQQNGQHQVYWNAGGLPAGIYFWKLSVGSQQRVAGRIIKI